MAALAALEHSIRDALGGFASQRRGTRVLSIDASQYDHDALRQLSQCLVAGELQRATRLREPARATYVVAHACLRLALSCTLRVSPGLVACQPATGKPRLEPALTQHRALDFSLSHTAQEVLIGLRLGGSIGVDIEQVDLAHPLLRHESKVCSAHELSQRPPARSQQQAARWLFGHWVCKEAYLKATGSGLLALPPRALTVRHSPKRKRWTMQATPSAQDCAVYALRVRSGYCAAACLVPPGRLEPLKRLVPRHVGPPAMSAMHASDD